MSKEIVYIDMDNVLVDFPSGISRISEQQRQEYADRLDEVPDIFSLMDPMVGAVEAFNQLAEIFDVYILSTAPWNNPSAWSDKLLWVQKHLGEPAYKRLILSHHKNRNDGAFLIDDRTKNGAEYFPGRHIHFGQEGFEDWQKITAYLRQFAEDIGQFSQFISAALFEYDPMHICFAYEGDEGKDEYDSEAYQIAYDLMIYGLRAEEALCRQFGIFFGTVPEQPKRDEIVNKIAEECQNKNYSQFSQKKLSVWI